MRLEPTYEGLKQVQADRDILRDTRLEPTYEGLKLIWVIWTGLECAAFGAYL